MYCINCGKSIPEFSKFCSHCGLSQTKVESTIKEKIADIIIETEILEQNIEEHHASMNLVFLKKIMGWYLTWVLIHLGLLLIFSDSIFAGSNNTSPFWPFGEKYRSISLSQYDIREFLVYTLFPLMVLLIVSLIIPHQKPTSISIPNDFVVNAEPEVSLPLSKSSDGSKLAIVALIIIMIPVFLLVQTKPREQSTKGSLQVQGYFIIKLDLVLPGSTGNIRDYMIRSGLRGRFTSASPLNGKGLPDEVLYYTESYEDTFTAREKKSRISHIKSSVLSQLNSIKYTIPNGDKGNIVLLDDEVIYFTKKIDADNFIAKL